MDLTTKKSGLEDFIREIDEQFGLADSDSILNDLHSFEIFEESVEE